MALPVGAVLPAGAGTLAGPVRRAGSVALNPVPLRSATQRPAHGRRTVTRNAVSTESPVEEVERVEGTISTPVASTSGSSKWTIDEDELLTSTWEHRAWVFGTSSLLLCTAAKGLWDVNDVGTGLGVGFSLLSAYVLAGKAQCAQPRQPWARAFPSSSRLVLNCFHALRSKPDS